MDKDSFFKCKAEITAFEDLANQLKQSAHSDYIAMEYLCEGFDKLNKMISQL